MNAQDDSAQEDSAQDRWQEESLERIERGQLPSSAERRLERMVQEGGAFTSELSVAEFALAHQLGLRPLAQVMGSCIYQVGWQYAGEGLYWGVEAYSQELKVISDAWNEARSRSLSRMRREAALLGADAVVGVHLQSGRYDWAASGVEFAVFGTAVHDSSVTRHGDAILTDLSLQEFAKLRSAGIEPCGLVAATSCFFVAASSETQMMGGLIGRMAFPENQELVAYTQGVYEARETALERLTDQIRAAGADGMVGVKITHQIREEKMKSSQIGQEIPGLIVTFHAAGTAIRIREKAAEYPPETAVFLST